MRFRVVLNKVHFANLIIRSVLTCYGVWGAVLVGDLAICEYRRPGQCDTQRAAIGGAATAIPATLLAWLADSPLQGEPKQRTNQSRSSATGKRNEEIPDVDSRIA